MTLKVSPVFPAGQVIERNTAHPVTVIKVRSPAITTDVVETRLERMEALDGLRMSTIWHYVNAVLVDFDFGRR